MGAWNFQLYGDSQNRGFSFSGSCHRKTCLLRRKTRFFLTPLKHLSLYLWWNILLVTQKLMRLYDFVIFFKKTTQAAVISKKIRTTRGYFLNWGQRPNCLDLSYPSIHSIFTLLLIKQTFGKNESSRVESGSRVQFWPRITPDYKKLWRKLKMRHS